MTKGIIRLLSVCHLACWVAMSAQAQVVHSVPDPAIPATGNGHISPNPQGEPALGLGVVPASRVSHHEPDSLMEVAMPGYTAAPTLVDEIHGAISPSFDAGVGREWLANAPFEIDSSQPLGHIRFRLDSAYNQDFPDRLEYFWSQSKGPDTSVDWQDIRFQLELGGKRFSVATDIPIRVIDPVNNLNTAGLGDMSLASKLVLCDGRTWQITQIFKSYFSTGSRTHGTGNGHQALEPGLLVRHKWNDDTHFHSEVKYWFPLGGDSDHSGEILRSGFGVSHLLYDSDAFAIIPTLEFVVWSLLDGRQTNPNTTIVTEIDGVAIVNLFPGMRFVCDPGGDWPMWDIGIAGGLPLTSDRWYDGMLRLDTRWRF